MKTNLIAHYKGGNSNKIYMACLVRHNNGYAVIGKWGRNGSRFEEDVKGRLRSLQEAIAMQRALFGSKIKKGYVDIDSQYYEGGVTRKTLCVERNLVPEDLSRVYCTEENLTQVVNNLPQVYLPTEDDDIVMCLDNTGIEDKFDEGIEYVSEPHPNAGMIYVYDKKGIKQECLKERFKGK